MKNTTALSFLLVCSTAFAQQVKITKTGEQSAKTNVFQLYHLSIYNNTNKPICIAVSNDFAYRLNEKDTLELGNTASEKDNEIVVSLFWSKMDLANDAQQHPSYPLVLNPRTYLVTNISVKKNPSGKGIYFDFMHSFGPDLDFNKISASYESEPPYVWMRSLKFFSEKFPMEN